VKYKYDPDNYLLWLLASCDHYALDTLKRIDSMLQNLVNECAIERFRVKLRSRNEVEFDSYLTELEFASRFKSRGFPVELEPCSGVDFKVTYKSLPVFFEAKYLFPEALRRHQRLSDEVTNRFSRIKEPFHVSLRALKTLKAKDIEELVSFVRTTLRTLRGTEQFPVSYWYPDERDAWAEISVVGRLTRPSCVCWLISVMRGVDSKTIRSKLRSKANKLPRNQPTCIVLARGTIFSPRESVEDALFGDETCLVDLATHRHVWSRGGDRFFRPKFNTSISAVCYYEMVGTSSDQSCLIDVYHNPYAKQPLPLELFGNCSVRQFVQDRMTGVISQIS